MKQLRHTVPKTVSEIRICNIYKCYSGDFEDEVTVLIIMEETSYFVSFNKIEASLLLWIVLIK